MTLRCRLLTLAFAVPMVVASSGSVAASEPVPTCLGEVATIIGTSATETIRGTAGPDVIVGRGSDTGEYGDTVHGRGGDSAASSGRPNPG
jgi:hypothetical protein